MIQLGFLEISSSPPDLLIRRQSFDVIFKAALSASASGTSPLTEVKLYFANFKVNCSLDDTDTVSLIHPQMVAVLMMLSEEADEMEDL